MTDQPRNRRLSDKIRAALEHAMRMGRRDLADRLRLMHDVCLDEEDDMPQQRRLRDKIRVR